MSKQNKTARLLLIDTIRGIALINMILYHFVWDIVFILGVDVPFYRTNAGYIWQQSICWTFIFISGFSFSLSKKPLKNGIKVFICGIIISAATIIAMPQNRVLFGILTFIGSAIIITCLLDKILIKVPPLIGIIISFLSFIITKNVNRGNLGFESIQLIPLPQQLYNNYLTAFFGFQPSDFYSTDYFSILPWIFLFLTGYYFHKNIKKAGKLEIYFKNGIIPIAFIGKHTLIIYMVHQPILYAITMAIAVLIY